MKYKPVIIIFLFSALLPVLTAVVSNWQIDYNSVIGFIAYFCLTIYCIKKYRDEISVLSILLILLIGRCLPNINVIYGYFVGEIWSLPFFILNILGIISGFLYLRLKKPLNILPIFFSFAFAVFMFCQGWEYWIHKRNYGTFTGNIKAYNPPTKFEVFDTQKNIITDENFKSKIVLLDFWNTRCGVCFEKFPQLQVAYDKYKNDSSVIIFAVNKPIEEDKPSEAFDVIKREGYTFPVVISKDEELPEKFGVSAYPTTFVIDQQGLVIYKGGIEGAVSLTIEMTWGETANTQL